MSCTIRHLQRADWDEWLRMRMALWPNSTPGEHEKDMEAIWSDAESPVWVAVRSCGKLGGFLEGGIRKYADGCETGPVGYIEGWYVEADLRRQGVGRKLVHALESWARERGFQEIGSDTWMENQGSRAAHAHLGYKETERLVHFIKKLT